MSLPRVQTHNQAQVSVVRVCRMWCCGRGHLSCSLPTLCCAKRRKGTDWAILGRKDAGSAFLLCPRRSGEPAGGQNLSAEEKQQKGRASQLGQVFSHQVLIQLLLPVRRQWRAMNSPARYHLLLLLPLQILLCDGS